MRTMLFAIPLIAVSAAALADQSQPGSAASPPAPVAASQLPPTVQEQLATVGLNDLMGALNLYHQKISCPAGQKSCVLRVTIQDGVMSSVTTEDSGTPAVPTPPSAPPHSP